MIEPRPGYCPAITTQGFQCATKTRDGRLCAVHRHPEPGGELREYHRCTGTIDGAQSPCWKRVNRPGALCGHHRKVAASSVTPEQAALRKVRRALDMLREALADLDKMYPEGGS